MQCAAAITVLGPMITPLQISGTVGDSKIWTAKGNWPTAATCPPSTLTWDACVGALSLQLEKPTMDDTSTIKFNFKNDFIDTLISV
jgi:hypothetical protein